MIQNPIVNTINNPKLLDEAFLEIQIALLNKLTWLDNTFGNAQRITKSDESKAVFPAIYFDNLDYFNLLPDGHLGNYVYFDVEDGQNVNDSGRVIKDFRVKVGLVVWYDMRSIYTDWKNKTTENVKHDFIAALQSQGFKKSSFRITKIYDEANNIYSGYNHNEIKNQFLMRPYGGFKIDLDFIYYNKELC